MDLVPASGTINRDDMLFQDLLFTGVSQKPVTKKKTLAELVPLPVKKRIIATRRKAKETRYVLTDDDNLKIVQDREKSREEKKADTADREAAKADKSALERADSLKKKVQQKGVALEDVFLGVGPTKLQVRMGLPGYRCLFCRKVFDQEAGGLGDQWVQCKSCNHEQHRACMEKARKCPCGAMALKKGK